MCPLIILSIYRRHSCSRGRSERIVHPFSTLRQNPSRIHHTWCERTPIISLPTAALSRGHTSTRFRTTTSHSSVVLRLDALAPSVLFVHKSHDRGRQHYTDNSSVVRSTTGLCHEIVCLLCVLSCFVIALGEHVTWLFAVMSGQTHPQGSRPSYHRAHQSMEQAGRVVELGS